MRKADVEADDELRPEYDASLLREGTRGKHAAMYKAGTNVALLAPDVAEAFPNDEAVNEALRLLMRIAKNSTGMPRPRRSRTKVR